MELSIFCTRFLLTITSPWHSAHVIATIVIGAVLLIAFIFWQMVAPYPMFPKFLFANKVHLDLAVLMAESLGPDTDRHGLVRRQFLVYRRFLAARMSGTVWS